ncbi:MAG: 40S ribosomal protein S17 [Nitrosopumilus sp.]|nr:40S ribosomal protein S17 [Nitrosopumilus sp.]
MDRIKRLSYEILDQNRSKFGENFTDNKKLLNDIAIIRSKGLKNEIAGYITKFIKKENYEEENKQSKKDLSNEDDTLIEEAIESETKPTQESEEDVIEVGVESTDLTETNESTDEKTQ